jgi:hypothetical protein
VAFIFVLLFLSFILERVFINRDIDGITRSLQSIGKNPSLALTARQKRLISSPNPASVKNSLAKKDKAIAQEVKLMQSSANINALRTLNQLATILSAYKCEIITFTALSGADFNAQIKFETKEELAKVESTLQASSIKNLFIEADMKKLILNTSGEESE